MILVADSGSTKTDWILALPGNETLGFRTIGLNPFFISEKDVVRVLSAISELGKHTKDVKEVYFFGTGCSSPDKREIISNALSQVFQHAYINVENDLLGCAYATCGTKKRLTCILGTGSNISYFDGEDVHAGKHGLGYILGDEGSGVYFGKKLLTDHLYGKMPEHLAASFSEDFKTDKGSVIRNVYQKPHPNSYLATHARFMSKHLDDPYIQGVLRNGFLEFVQTNIHSYPEYRSYKTHFVGSIAYHFRDILSEVCMSNGIQMGKILKHPIEELFGFVLEREQKLS